LKRFILFYFVHVGLSKLKWQIMLKLSDDVSLEKVWHMIPNSTAVGLLHLELWESEDGKYHTIGSLVVS
jgi:hypothetical protein